MKSWKVFFSKKIRPLKPRRLPEVYRTLLRAFGHQAWWPGQTRFEIMAGAILTQNTAWSNVEKAIANLKRAGLLNPAAMQKIPQDKLAALIRPSGYFNIKALRLKSFVDFIFREYGGSLSRMAREKGELLREKLLAVNGIGPETADSILLYGLKKPFFVIDAYTKRVFLRHRLHSLNFSKRESPASWQNRSYEDWQQLFTNALPPEPELYNDFHAQIVMLGKNHCKASNPLCPKCPLAKYL